MYSIREIENDLGLSRFHSPALRDGAFRARGSLWVSCGGSGNLLDALDEGWVCISGSRIEEIGGIQV